MTEDDPEALQEAIYREKVERARRMTALEKFEAGQRLFEIGCLQMLGNIRGQMPDATGGEWRAEMGRPLRIGRRLDDMQLAESYRG